LPFQQIVLRAGRNLYLIFYAVAKLFPCSVSDIKVLPIMYATGIRQQVFASGSHKVF